jgi:hypothetical protein
MVKKLSLILERDASAEKMEFRLRRMVNAGYTGRNQELVKRHIEELKKEGIPAPESIPTAYEVISKLIYFDNEIEVVGEKTSGEAEFVLLCAPKEVYVGVGSDHTDRDLESVSIIKSKQVCPNIMSTRVWNLKDIRKDWDEIMLRSWVKNEGGDKILYQEAPLAAILKPEDLMDFVQNKLEDGDLNGVAIFSGTVALIPEKFIYSRYFETELHNPRTNQKLNCAYRVNVLDYLKGQKG